MVGRVSAMWDDALTYGGSVVGLAALGVWLWVAIRALPSFDAFVRGFDDELHLGAAFPDRAGDARRHRIRRTAVALTAVAALCLSVAYSIPD